MNSPVSIPDTQSQRDTRGLLIQQAGIRGLHMPARITDVDGQQHITVAKVQASVSVPAEQKGTHMSRFVEYAHDWANDIQLNRLLVALDGLLGLLQAEHGAITLEFPWFVWRHAPRSGRGSWLDVDVCIDLQRDERDSYRLSVKVPVTSLCPCSKAISDYGAHNQRSSVTLSIEPDQPASLAQMISLVENNASSPVYAVLKREDEKYVTEQAYDNPRFAEDMVREIALSTQAKLAPWRGHVETENQESIHNHAAFAEIDWQRK